MKGNRFRKKSSHLSNSERRRRKREIIISVVVLVLIILMTFAENRVIHFGSDFPVSNAILMFILININLLLLILLIFLVFRNLVKLLYDRKRKVMGSKLRTRLVLAFIGLTLLPTIVLFFFSVNFITSSIEFWFNIPVEKALENSESVGQRFYEYVEDNNRFFLQRIAYQIKTKKLLNPGKRKYLSNYINVVQREFNLQFVEIYDALGPSWKVKRLAAAAASEFRDDPFDPVLPDNLYKEIGPRGVRSISDHPISGELRRTIGTIPFGAKRAEAEAFVVLSVLIPSDLSKNMDHISNGIEEYRQRKMVKEPLQITYYITISIVALLVLFCAIWLGFYLAKTISVPIKELAEGTRKVAEGDLSFSIGIVADDEIGSLVDSFNKMTRDLRSGREQLELSAQMLKERNIEIEKRRQYMEIVLQNVSTGVVTLDEKGLVTTTNKSAEKMLNINAVDVLGKSYKKLLRGRHLGLAGEVMETLSASRNGAVEFPLRLAIGGSPKSFMLRVNALKDDAGSRVGLVMVCDDLTELEKAQRTAAWREVARRIAHEVKNPLTPIKLSAQRLQRRYSQRIDESVFDECTRMIIDHVGLIQNLVNEFSTFARFPTADPKPCNLPPIIDETVALFREGHENVAFHISMPENPPKLNIDRQQIKQAMINLVNNAIGAIREEGNICITVIRNSASGNFRIEVADDGSGIPDEKKTRLFEPYFSTKKKGMGLGLSIVNSIVADHNGTINVQDNHPRGAKFIIELPA